MKILENTTIYQCEYCGRISLSNGGTKYHERFCKKNLNIPTSSADCFSCSLLKVVDAEGELQTALDATIVILIGIRVIPTVRGVRRSARAIRRTSFAPRRVRKCTMPTRCTEWKKKSAMLSFPVAIALCRMSARARQRRTKLL